MVLVAALVAMLLSIVGTDQTVPLLTCCVTVDAFDANAAFETFTDDKVPLFEGLVVVVNIVCVDIDVTVAEYVVLTATFKFVLSIELIVEAVE